MISYTLHQKNPDSHYIYVDLLAGGLDGSILKLQLPAWRPGRYELGNFARNVKRVDAYSEKGETLPYRKLSKDCWEIDLQGNTSVKVTYSYYAAELNAGSCFADRTQLYVNPVHLCMFIPSATRQEHRITLKLPEGYRIASSLKFEGYTAVARNFDQLADSPFIASPTLVSDEYTVGGRKFHLHFQGECSPDLAKIKNDFAAFTSYQIGFWGDFPAPAYHFLFQITPQRFYHGVEHEESTVIALGPGYALNAGSTYEDLLGVSSHELFHTWNVKKIRPAEMLPYDFTKENYSRTGFVYEGFTTYYGDKMLLSSGVFSLQQYFATLEERLLKHFHNYGRFNLGVAGSSWDTWLDGYVPGAPYRKTSIYDEGCLVAFMLDTLLLRESGGKSSLREVCRLLYQKFGDLKSGYTEQDILDTVNQVSGRDMTEFFSRYIYGTGDFTDPLLSCCSFLGWKLEFLPAPAVSEHAFGFKIADGQNRISLVAPYSPAWKAGLFAGDEIIAVNGVAARTSVNQWLQHFAGKGDTEITYISGEQLRTCALRRDPKGSTYFAQPKLSVQDAVELKGHMPFQSWLSC